MSTLTTMPAKSKPDVLWIEPPLWPCAILPHGRPGTVEINGVAYAVLPVEEDLHTFAFILTRDGLDDWYQVNTVNWHCTCPHATYRGEGVCKHSHALRDAYEGRVP